MKAVLIAVLLVAAFAAKVSTEEEVVFSQLREFEKDNFGKKLLDTIALQLNNNAPLAEVAKLLQKIRENIILTQKDADSRQEKNTADCRAELHELNGRIDRASNEISEATSLIAQLNTQISGLQRKLVTNSNILSLLDGRSQALREQRKSQSADYHKRVRRFEEVIAALDLIIGKVREIKPDAANTKAALVELSRIGNSNPILALVQIASTFSKDTLDTVLQKLTLLRASFEASNSEDRAAETKASADYETLLNELGDTRSDIASGKEEAATKLKEAQASLSLQKKRKTDSRFQINAAAKSKKQKTSECEQWEIEFRAESSERSRQVSMLKKVENILATRLASVKSYVQRR